MAYVLIDENNVVVDREIEDKDGYVKVHDSIICGMVHDGGSSYAKATFSIPAKVYSWDEVRAKQRAMIVVHDDMMSIHEREVLHAGTDEANYTITPAQFQEMLDYFQVIRANDEATHSTPNEAIDALNALSLPSFLTS